jgi:hypothetical protein
MRRVKRNSQYEIVQYLQDNPCRTESEIQQDVWNYYRRSDMESNKKYADMLRRALFSGKIRRVRMKIHGIDNRMMFRYYVKW